MANNNGASLRDRAATPSEPSPAVSGIAGIPSAALLRLADRLDREGHAFALVADFRQGGGSLDALGPAQAAAEYYMLADVLRARAALSRTTSTEKEGS